MNFNHNTPVPGCWVSIQVSDNIKHTGIVQETFEGRKARVRWIETRKESVVHIHQLSNGFKSGMDVIIKNRKSDLNLGEGIIKLCRTVGGSEQLLVEFNSTAQRRWIPFQFLRHVKGVKHGFATSKMGDSNQAKRLRLRILAQALTVWNENTGALSSLDIDPLPHQIHLVHRIIDSGNLNWMIADDVGLGKTIETGMLLAALRQKGRAKRVLLITPAGLTKQWQDEMHDKFGFGEFQIYGDDFTINEPRHWKMHDHVIASIDRLKSDSHKELLLQAAPWDLVVFDEAHRLSRRQYGFKFNSSGRFELAADLRERNRAPSLLMLTATPHQGMQDKFTALLELLRPELKDEIKLLNYKPELLNQMVIRNYKADVTDLDGNFVFHGKSTHAMTVHINEQAKAFDRLLQNYLKQGYQAGKALGQKGNAIGFVMTVYRKLASSSVEAIHRALKRRRDRIRKEFDEHLNTSQQQEDDRFQGEAEENTETARDEFFIGEIELIEKLIDESKDLRKKDLKLQLFLDEMIKKVLEDDPNKKILIFSEYRATQDYLKNALSSRYDKSNVDVLHGSMSRNERTKAIENFEGAGQFLISTEAGGEGINLQRYCHIMMNYDLPWNPMRLVQRIGRLYRYGQKQQVVVFNIHSPETIDEKIIGLMYERIEQVVTDLAVVQGDEFNEALKDDILGEIADLVDIEEILDAASGNSIERTKERIDEALQKAKDSAAKQHKLFQHAASFDPNELNQNMTITTAHVEIFIAGMCDLMDIEITKRTHNDKVWHLKLPENIMMKLGTRRSKVEVTCERVLAKTRKGTVMMDMDSELLLYFINTAVSFEFEGKTSAVQAQPAMGSAFIVGLLRWQNDLGQRLKQDFCTFSIKDNIVSQKPSELSHWLLQPARYSDVCTTNEQNQQWLSLCEKAANQMLADQSTEHLYPEQVEWVGAGWVAAQTN